MRYCYWVRGREYDQMLELSMASARRVDPAAKFHVIEMDMDRPAMVANLDAQISCLSEIWTGEGVYFLDADILLRRAFDMPITDIVATWRDHVGYSEGEKVSGVATLMPYNYGVMGMRAGAKALEILIWLRARILKMSSTYQNWYGNQMALAELLGKAPAAGEEIRDLRLRWGPMDSGTPFSAQLLPCDIYNYSPESADEDVSERRVLHLKGARKAWMNAYAQAA